MDSAFMHIPHKSLEAIDKFISLHFYPQIKGGEREEHGLRKVNGTEGKHRKVGK